MIASSTDSSFSQQNVEKFKVSPSFRPLNKVLSPSQKADNQTDMFKHQKSLFSQEGSKQEHQIMSTRCSLNFSTATQNDKRNTVNYSSPTRYNLLNNLQTPKKQKSSLLFKSGSPNLASPHNKQSIHEDSNSDKKEENDVQKLPRYALLHQKSLLSNSVYHSKASRSPLYQNHVIIQPSSSPLNINNSIGILSSIIKNDDSLNMDSDNQQNKVNRNSNVNTYNLSTLSKISITEFKNSNNINNSSNEKKNNNTSTQQQHQPQREKPNLTLDQLLTTQFPISTLSKSPINSFQFSSESHKMNSNNNVSMQSKYTPRLPPQNSPSSSYRQEQKFSLNKNSRQWKDNSNDEVHSISKNMINKSLNDQSINSVLYPSNIDTQKKKQIGYISMTQRSHREIPAINISSTLNQLQASKNNFLSGRNSQKPNQINYIFYSNNKDNNTTNINQNGSVMGQKDMTSSENNYSNKSNNFNNNSIIQLCRIVNHYDEKKYNLNRFNSLASSRKQLLNKDNKNIQNENQKLYKSSQNIQLPSTSNDFSQNSLSQCPKQNISTDSSTFQLIKRITIQSTNQRGESLSPTNKLRSTSLNPLEKYETEKSETKGEQIRLNGLSKILNFSNSVIKSKQILTQHSIHQQFLNQYLQIQRDKKKTELDVQQELGGQSLQRVLIKLNQKIQQKVANPFINQIGGIDYVESVILKFHEYINDNSLQEDIVFDFSNLYFQLFILHALGAKLNLQKTELQNNLKNIGMNFKQMRAYKQLMRQYVFEESQLIEKQFEVEFFRRLTSCEQYLMKYNIIEKIGGEQILKKVVETFHQNMVKVHPLYEKSGYSSNDVYQGLLFLIIKEDYLEMTFDFFVKIQKEMNLTHLDLYIAKKQLQAAFETHGVLERPVFHILEILDAVRPFVTQGYAHFPKNLSEQDTLLNEISRDIYKQIFQSEVVQSFSLEEKKALSFDNILTLLTILIKPYTKPYYRHIQYSYKNNNSQSYLSKQNLNSLIRSRVFPVTVDIIIEYIQNVHKFLSSQLNEKSNKIIISLSPIQRKYSSLFNYFFVTDIKQKLNLLAQSSILNNSNHFDQITKYFQSEISPNIIQNALREYLTSKLQIKEDLYGGMSEEKFQYCSNVLFRFFLNQFIDDFPIRISSYDLYTMITEYKLTSKFIEKLFKILWKVFQMFSFPEQIIESLYVKYLDIKDFLIYSCESQKNINHEVYSTKSS